MVFKPRKLRFRRQTISMEKPVKLFEPPMDNIHFKNATPEFLDPNANDIGEELNIPGYRFSVGQLPAWAKKKVSMITESLLNIVCF